MANYSPFMPSYGVMLGIAYRLASNYYPIRYSTLSHQERDKCDGVERGIKVATRFENIV